MPWAFLESKGPIFFRQTRAGQGGRPFEILKFRSMKVEAPKYARSPDEHNDPRITRVGASFAAPASMKCRSSSMS
jgi:lipopolysaccharide/colanic/teichoic acid biosynthesis glycosyltransferase